MGSTWWKTRATRHPEGTTRGPFFIAQLSSICWRVSNCFLVGSVTVASAPTPCSHVLFFWDPSAINKNIAGVQKEKLPWWRYHFPKRSYYFGYPFVKYVSIAWHHHCTDSIISWHDLKVLHFKKSQFFQLKAIKLTTCFPTKINVQTSFHSKTHSKTEPYIRVGVIWKSLNF